MTAATQIWRALVLACQRMTATTGVSSAAGRLKTTRTGRCMATFAIKRRALLPGR